MNITFFTPKKDLASGWADTYIADSMRKAFVKLGHECILIDESDLPSINKNGLMSDIVISHKETLIPNHKLSPNTTFVYWAHNTSEIPDGYDYYFTARSEDWVKKIEDFFNRPCKKLDLAVDTDLFNPKKFNSEKKHDIVYVGHKLDKNYNRYLMPASKFNLEIYGAPYCWANDVYYAFYYQGQIDYNDLPALYNNSKLILNFHCKNNPAMDMLTSRPFEVLAMNGVLMSDDIPCMKNMGLPYISLDNGDLQELYDKYLNNDTARDIVSQDGRDFIIKHKHTYLDRAKAILKVVK